MPSLVDKVAFAEKHITAPDGEPFSLKGRDWVLDEIWRPLDSWKLWPNERGQLCKECSRLANTMTEDYAAAAPTQTAEHVATGCVGLRVEPIVIVAANLKRQSGKTFNTAAWAMARAFKDDRESIALLAGSEDQVQRLYTKNYKRPIENSKILSKHARCLGTRIIIDKTGSDIELLPTALSSVGDTRTAVVIDECRVVPPNIAVALIPTLFARGGWHCPDYHVRTHSGVEDPDAPRECSVCASPMQPWYGKALLLSSAGELDETEADWFFDFVAHYQKNPHPNVHVFSSQETLNPKVSQKMVSVVADVFGALESTKVYADIEAGNESRRKGDDVLTKAELKRCADVRLSNAPECDRPCVAFLDTSLSVEKTSLVVLADDPDSAEPWERVYTPRIDWWDPADMPGHVIDEKVVENHLRKVLPLYTGLRTLHIDARQGAGSGETWARRVAQRLSKDGFMVQLWEKSSPHESMAGWSELIKRVRTGTIRFIELKEIFDEFKGVKRRRRSDGSDEIVDRDRAKMHKDITETMALCCYLVALEVMKRGSGMKRIREIGQGVAERMRGRLDSSNRPRVPQGSIAKRFGPNSY